MTNQFRKTSIPLIAARRRTVPLKLVFCKKFSDGVVRLHYEVEKEKPKGTLGKRSVKKPK